MARHYVRKPGAGRPPKPARQVFEAVVYVLRTGCQWKALPKERFGSASAVHKRFLEWERPASSRRCGKPGWPSTTRWKASLGDGRASTGRCSRRRWRKKLSGPTRRIGGKKGSKRHLLVDGRGVPLSLIVTAANVNDGKRLDEVLQRHHGQAQEHRRMRRNKHLCADAGYRSAGVHCRSSSRTATSLMSSIAARKLKPSGATRRRRPGAGWSRSATAGSTASASCSCATRSSSAASSPSTTSPPPSSRSARCRWASTLFTDRG